MSLNLIDMPNNIMLMIMEKTDLFSILTLRKVCRDFRNFIDDVHPTVPVDKLSIDISVGYIEVKLNLDQSVETIIYQNKIYGCLVSNSLWQYRESAGKHLKKLNFTDIFIRDLGLILSTIRYSEIMDQLILRDVSYYGKRDGSSMEHCDQILKAFETCLQSKTRPLKVKKLEMTVVSDKDLMSILPYLEAGTLEEINIEDPRSSNTFYREQRKLDISEVVKSKQWKHARVLKIEDYSVNQSIEKCLHFGTAKLILDSICIEDVIKLKKNAQTSSCFRSFDITCNNFNDQDQLFVIFGPSEAVIDCFVWYFWMLDLKKVLHVLYAPTVPFKLYFGVVPRENITGLIQD